MQKRTIAVMLLLFLVVLPKYGGAAQAPVRPAAIDGTIFLPTSQALDRYEILVLSKDGEQVIGRTYSEITGHYHFAGIPPDAIDVVARIEGYEEARVTVYLSPGKTSIVNILMTPKGGTTMKIDPNEPSVVNIDELNRKYPKKAVDDFAAAQDSKRKGDNSRALELLEGVVKLSPDYFDAHNLLGTIYQGMDRYRDAEKQYNLARDLSPGSVQPLVNLVTLYLQEAEANQQEGPLVTAVMFDDAIRVLKEAGRLEPRNATIFYLTGVTSYRSRSYRVAELSFNEALSIDETMGTARLALANVYIREQKWKDALKQFDIYLKENPKAADRAQVEAIRSRVIQQL